LAAAISEAEALPLDVDFFFVVFVVVVGVACWVEVSACGFADADGMDSENSRHNAASHVIVFICTLLIVFLSMLDGNCLRINPGKSLLTFFVGMSQQLSRFERLKPLLFNTSSSTTEQPAGKMPYRPCFEAAQFSCPQPLYA